MTAVTASEARTRFSELVNLASVAKERVVIQRHQRPIAALVSIDELELLDDLLAAARDDTEMQDRLAQLRSTREHRAAIETLAWPGEDIVLSPKAFKQTVDRIYKPRPATQALKDLMAADGD